MLEFIIPVIAIATTVTCYNMARKATQRLQETLNILGGRVDYLARQSRFETILEAHAGLEALKPVLEPITRQQRKARLYVMPIGDGKLH
jgi:hypothetical protein